MEQCLTIVGRSKSAKKFTESFVETMLESLNEEQFEIESVEYLGDFAELDGMSRFIGFILIHDDSKKLMKIEQLFSSLISLQMGVRLFENISDAKSYAEEHYSYSKNVKKYVEENEDEYDEEEDGDEEDNEEEDEEYPRFTAEEIEDFLMFESLFRTGKLATIRGKVYDKPVTVMAQIINGPDMIRVTPYAIMINSDILENMDLPKIDERD